MYKILRNILIVWTIIALSANMAIAQTFEHLYGIKIKNKDEIHMNLLNSYQNNYATKMSSTYFYDNEDRYYLAYLAAINNNYAYYYYLSNVNDLKNNEFLNFLNILGYQYEPITNKSFISLYKNNALNQNIFDGKLQAIRDGNFTEYVLQNKMEISDYLSPSLAQLNYQRQQIPVQQQYQQQQQYQTITIPAGYPLKLLTTYSVNLCSIKSNQSYTTILAEDIIINGKTVIPRGSRVEGILRPHLYRSYNNNYMEVSFNKIMTPNGKTYNIRTENLSIYNNVPKQYEYTSDGIYGNSNSSSQNTNTTMTTGQKVAVGAAVVGIAALIVVAAVVGSKDNSGSSSNSSTNTSTTTTNRYDYQTPEDLCYKHDVTIETSAVFDIILTVPLLI